MKRVTIFTVLSLLIFINHSCIEYYKSMTHLSDEELEWITNRYVGEVWYFQSQEGVIDTATITKLKILNSTNPINWNAHTYADPDYRAFAYVNISMRGQRLGMSDFFLISKQKSEEPVYFRAKLFNRLTNKVPLQDICLMIDSMLIDDAVFFDEKVMDTLRWNELPSPIMNYAWSKKYGLLQYTFQDGITYSRIDLKQH